MEAPLDGSIKVINNDTSTSAIGGIGILITAKSGAVANCLIRVHKHTSYGNRRASIKKTIMLSTENN